MRLNRAVMKPANALNKGGPDKVVFQVRDCNGNCSEEEHNCEEKLMAT